MAGFLQVKWDRSKVDGRLLLARCELEEALNTASIYAKALKAMDALQLNEDGSVPPFARIAEVGASRFIYCVASCYCVFLYLERGKCTKCAHRSCKALMLL